MRTIIKCKGCHKSKELHAKGLCNKCYLKQYKPKEIICKRCNRKLPKHGKGMCSSCYNFVFKHDGIRSDSIKKTYGLTVEEYQKLTKECVVCGFDIITELHHLNGNKKNNDPNNVICLCPNHHKMIHRYDFWEQVVDDLKRKGINCLEYHPSNNRRRK